MTNFFRTNYIVRAGVLDVRFAGAVDKKISQAIQHPQYDDRYFDVGVLVLESPLTFSDKIAPICLPCESQPDPGSLTKQGITSQGWGRDEYGKLSESLDEIDVTVRSKSECDYKYNSTTGTFKWRVSFRLPELISSTLFCADNNNDHRIGVCAGDSGGPNFVR